MKDFPVLTPQGEALCAVYDYLRESGYSCWGLSPHGIRSSFSVRGKRSALSGEMARTAYFEVSLSGVELWIAEHVNDRNIIVIFDLNDPECFDKLLVALGEVE